MSDSEISSSGGVHSPTFGTATFTTLSVTETRSVTPSRLSPSPARSRMSLIHASHFNITYVLFLVTPSTTQYTPSYTTGYSSDPTPQATTQDEESNLAVTFAQLNAEIGTAMRSWAVPRYAQDPPREVHPSEDYWQTDYPNPRLSTITERTENPQSRPTSFAETNLSARRPDQDATPIRATRHNRASTDVPQIKSPPFGPRAPTGPHVGEKVAYWEHRLGVTSPNGTHSRSSSEPSGSSIQDTLTTFSRTAPTYATSSDYTTMRSISPSRSYSVSDTYTPSQTYTDTISGSDTLSRTFTNTASSSMTQTSLTSASTFRRPQGSPRSPLSAVRNIMQKWREQTPVNPKSPSIPSSTSIGVKHVRRGPSVTPKARVSEQSQPNDENRSDHEGSHLSSPNDSVGTDVHVQMVSDYVGATTQVGRF